MHDTVLAIFGGIGGVRDLLLNQVPTAPVTAGRVLERRRATLRIGRRSIPRYAGTATPDEGSFIAGIHDGGTVFRRLATDILSYFHGRPHHVGRLVHVLIVFYLYE